MMTIVKRKFMSKYFYTAILLSAALFFFAGCAKQPPAPTVNPQKENNVLWDENSNVDADEDDNVDVSDLDKDVTSGDETQQPSREALQRIAFPVGEYQALDRTGKGTIQGHIYIQDPYGKRIYGAKTRLYLNPVTSYSRQWYKESYINGRKMGKADSRLFNYLKFTASDDEGSFAFYGVPSGRYYLIGTVTCGVECGYQVDKSIRIASEVYIEGNQIVDQDLSKAI